MNSEGYKIGLCCVFLEPFPNLSVLSPLVPVTRLSDVFCQVLDSVRGGSFEGSTLSFKTRQSSARNHVPSLQSDHEELGVPLLPQGKENEWRQF